MSITALIASIRNHRGACRALFLIYALIVVAATHWPRLEIPGAEVNSDKIAHLGAYGLWTLLAFSSGFFGRAFTRGSLLRTALLAAIYSSLDEASQLIPVFGRQASAADALANLGGVLTAYALALIVIRPEPEEPVKVS